MPTVDTATVLRLALEGSPSECYEATGMPRHRVIQDAIRLARDPVVALEQPELVGRVLARVKARPSLRQG